MSIIGKDSVWGKSTYPFCSFFSEHMSCFSQSSTSLYEVIDEEHITIFRISFFYSDDSIYPITHFGTDDSRILWKGFIESFGCSIIWKSYNCLWCHIEERESSMELSIDSE